MTSPYGSDPDAVFDRVSALEHENRRLTDELARTRGEPTHSSDDISTKASPQPDDLWLVWMWRVALFVSIMVLIFGRCR